MLWGAKHVTMARKVMSELVAPLWGLNVSGSLLLLLVLLSLPNFCIMYWQIFFPHPKISTSELTAIHASEYKSVCAECSGNDWAEAVQGYHI